MSSHSRHIDNLKMQGRALAERQSTANLNRTSKEKIALENIASKRKEQEENRAIENRKLQQREEEAANKITSDIKIAEIRGDKEIEAINKKGSIDFTLAEQAHRHKAEDRSADFQNEITSKNAEYSYGLATNQQLIQGRLQETVIKENADTLRKKMEVGGKKDIARLQAERDVLINQIKIKGDLEIQANNHNQERIILAETQSHELDRIDAETAAFLRQESSRRKTYRKNALVDMAVATNQTELNIYERIILMLAEKKIFGGRQNAEQVQAVEEIVKNNIAKWEQEFNS